MEFGIAVPNGLAALISEDRAFLLGKGGDQILKLHSAPRASQGPLKARKAYKEQRFSPLSIFPR
jgi:hypothetical protein